MTPTHEPPSPQSPENGIRVTRRRVLQSTAVAAGVAALSGVAETAGAATGPKPAGSLQRGYRGDISDLKHVVILMQENRSFDHYLGQLPGVRGQNDKQVLRFQDGTDVFSQRDATGSVVAPFVSTSQEACNHSFYAADGGRWDTWVVDKGSKCMKYHTPDQMPWMYSLAAQYTVCDMNFCSLHGPTIPNRYYFMSGTSNGETSNANQNNYARTWLTVPEQLQQAGIDWRIYSDNSGHGKQGSLQSGYLGEYGCNVVNSFANFDNTGLAEDDPKLAPGTGLIWRGNSSVYTPAPADAPNDDSEANLDYVLRDLVAACEPDAEHPLPEVSWVVMPAAWSEHPSFDTVHGERYMTKVLQILQSNQEIWNHTLVIVTYDENDGLFDHVLPPRPEEGTANEFSGTTPYGFGPRVPMLLISPWTRGGWVASEVFDHTSTVKFLETWSRHLGKPFTCPNITPWRRSIAGDLTSAIDFAHPQPGPVTIADPVSGTPPVLGPDAMKARGLSFHANATLVEDGRTGEVTAVMTLAGGPAGKAVSLQVFPDAYLDFANTPFTVSARQPREYTWDTTATDGRYAFSIYGPDGFVRSFAGQVGEPDPDGAGSPRVRADLVRGRRGVLRLTLHNDGGRPLRYQVAANDYDGGRRTVVVWPGRTKSVEWPTSEGYYDVVITADSGTDWTQRYAGRVASA